MQGNIKIWLEAARPKTLWASISPVLIGSALAAGDELFYWPAALATLLSAMAIQIATNFANDYFDHFKGADTEERLGPVRATAAGLVKPSTMKKAFVATFLFAFVVGLFLIYRGGWPILAIGLLSILFGILYTGGPYPLAYNGLGDIFVLIFFGPVAVGGTYYLQTLDLTTSAVIAGFAPGLISTSLLTVNNLRDIETDARAGKRTLAVRFGRTFARIEYLLTVVVACLIPVFLYLRHPEREFLPLALIVLIPALPAVRKVFTMEIGAGLNTVLAQTGKLLLIHSIVFSITWML
jgi:1,4-dihydroxy-2-naphthoate octaprenyltransferase